MTSIIQSLADWIPTVVEITTLVSLLVLAPLGIFHKTRGFAGGGLFVASMIFGAILWINGAVITFSSWGWIGLIIGLLIVGIGVVPMAFVALALQSEWAWVGQLALLLASVLITRFLGAWYVSKAEARTAV